MIFQKCRVLRPFLVVVSIALVVLALGARATAESPPAKVRVGIIAPLSGSIAVWGRSIQSAIELANSLSSSPAELYFADEETCVATKSLSAFHELTSQKKVDVLVASCLNGARALAPLAKARSLPLFISGRSSSEFQRDYPNALSFISLLDAEGREISNLIRQRGWSRASAMVSSDYFGVQFLEGIRAGAQDIGASFSLEAKEYPLDGAPIGPEVLALLRGKPDVVFLMLSDQAAGFVVKQLRAMQFRGDVVLQSSMLQTYDRGVRAAFRGALQQKFAYDDAQFLRLRRQIEEPLGQEVADDFVFSFDGFSVMLREANGCRGILKPSFEECLKQRMRTEEWRRGASGSFRFMKDGSTERPMVVRVVSEIGFESVDER